MIGAAAAASPEISLDMAEGVAKYSTYYGHAARTAAVTKSATYTANVQALGRHTSKAANSFAAKCEVQTATAKSCPEPAASAYDHHDGSSVSVSKAYNYFVVSRKACVNYGKLGFVAGMGNVNTVGACRQQEAPANVNIPNAKTFAFYGNRGEFIIKYDAKDRAGNEADQLVFAMIMEDTVAPTFTGIDVASKVEACDMDRAAKYSRGCSDRKCFSIPENVIQVTDKYDGSMGTMAANSGHMKYTAGSYKSGAKQMVMDSSKFAGKSASVSVKFTASDYANIFGKSYANNVATTSRTFTLQDTIAPRTVSLFSLQQPTNAAAAQKMTVAGTGNLIQATKYANAKAACQDANMRRGWGSKTATAACVGYKNGQLYSAGASTSITLVNTQTYMECGTTYNEPGFRCIDIRDSFTTTAQGIYKAAYNNGQGASKYHVNSDVTAMMSAPTYSSGTKGTKSLKTVAMNSYNNAKGLPLFKTGSFTTTYACKDTAGHSSTSTRTVSVVDTIKPTLSITEHGMKSMDASRKSNGGTMNAGHYAYSAPKSLSSQGKVINNGGKSFREYATPTSGHVEIDSYTIQHSAGFSEDAKYIAALAKPYSGYACKDSCDGDLTATGMKLTWHKNTCAGAATTFNTLIPGTYALKYVCADAASNSVQKCRTIKNEDHTKPVITVLEADSQTYEATRSDNYVDAGATCSDEVDGNISQDVEVSGDVVNLARVGVYTIKYNCVDSANNKADEAKRTVTVQDTTCPQCEITVDKALLNGGKDRTLRTETIEASFPYDDAGAVATDSLQGKFGICSTWSNGKQHASYKSIVNVETTGTYKITYRVKDSNGNWNDGSCTKSQGASRVRTIVIVDTLRPVIALKYGGKVIHKGASADRAHHNNAANPAGAYKFMAEQATTSSVNGWVIGAVASAVSGLALLGYSLRKSTPVATSVPV
jgi:hypothetical protein